MCISLRRLPPRVIACQHSRTSFTIHRSAYSESFFGKSKLPKPNINSKMFGTWHKNVVARMNTVIYTHQTLFISSHAPFLERENTEIIGVKFIFYGRNLFLSDNSDMNSR